MFMPEQYATVLNNVFGEVIGMGAWVDADGNPVEEGTEGATKVPSFKEDLSNFIDVGKRITASSEWGNNFDRYVGKLIDQIGKIVVEDKTYVSSLPKLEVDSFEYGAILEKIRVGEIEFEENPAWNLEVGQEYNYTDYKPVDADAKFFSNKTSFLMHWSWAVKTLKSAFDSKSTMMKLFSAIENKIRIKKQITTDNIKLRLINAINAENIAKGNVVNLLEAYRESTGNTTLTADVALTNKEFLQHTNLVLKKYAKFMGVASKFMNNEEVLNWTNKPDMMMVAICDLDAAMDTYLYSNTYHDNFVKFEGYSSIANWQVLTKDLSFENRSAINVSLASDANKQVRQSGIVFVMFDKGGAVVYNENDETDSAPFNPVGKFINYYYSYDCSYMLDLGENSVTFIVSDYTPIHEEPADWGTATNKYYYIDDDGNYATVTSSDDYDSYDVVYVKIA